jgi:hypothetical protein
LGAIAFAAVIGPNRAATLEVRGHKTGRKISFPVVVADYQGDRYLVAMLGQKTNWVRNLRADKHAVLLRRKRENVSLVEDFSSNRAAILRRYLEPAPTSRRRAAEWGAQQQIRSPDSVGSACSTGFHKSSRPRRLR